MCGFIQKMYNSLEIILKDSYINKKDIDDIILIGGSTNISKIQQLIKDFFKGKELILKSNKFEEVSYGATIMAAIMINLREEK